MAQIECRQMMRAIARPGGRVKMHCSGAGKAILGWTPDDDLTRIVRQHGLKRFTEHRSTPRAACGATSAWSASAATPWTTRSTPWACAAWRRRCLTSTVGR